MKNLFTFLFSIFISYLTFAQPQNSLVEDGVMPAPQAAAMGKFGDVPVSHYTGVPNISVPIYSLSQGPLSVPITMQYHAGGHKVGILASWVGLGWNLSAGGQITRTTLGLPDELPSTGYLAAESSLPSSLSSGTLNDYADIADGQLDGEPDLFSFQVLGHSGKFYLDGDSVILVPKQDYKITYTLESGSSVKRLKQFVITDSEGTKYYFGTHPITSAQAMATAQYDFSNQVVSSWMLQRVETHDGQNAIDLEYDLDTYLYYSPTTKRFMGEESVGANPLSSQPRYVTVVQRDYLVSKITSNIEEVIFHADTLRDDIPRNGSYPDGHLLNSIEIKSKANSSFCKEFDFYYDYFEDNSSNKNTLISLGDAINLRLKLDSIQEKSCTGGIEIPPYKFDYSGPTNVSAETGQDRKYFPQVMSLAIDSWGFYNGAGSNNTLEYNIPETTVDRGVYGDLTYGEADRSSNESTMTYGLISKMTYPTGGATSFEFEANDYYGTVPASEEEALNFYSPCGGFSVYSSTLSFDNQDEADDATFVLKPENTTGCSTMLTTFNLEMNLYEYNGSYTFLEKVSMSVSLGDSATGNLQTIFSGTTLQPGVDYRFELDDQEANSRLKVNIPIDAYMDNIPVGGVRVKQIISSDGMSLADDIVRKYRYRQFSDTSKSSGYLLKKPVHGMRIEYAPTSSYSGIENGHCFTEASVAPLSSFEGNHITYDEISEIHPGNGHIDFLFDLEESYTTPIDPDNLTPSDFPFLDLPARINAGNMISKKIYSESGDSIRSEYMSPKSDDLYEQSGKTIIRCQRIPTTASFQPIGINEYDIRTKPYRLEQIRVRLDGVETNTYYEYDSGGDHLMPIQERTINSNGDTIDTRFTYPFDYTDDVYEEMVARNMISPKIETGKYVNDVQVDGSRKSYAFYAGGDTLLTKSLVADTIKPIYLNKVERFHCSWDSTGVRTLDNPGGSMDGWMGRSGHHGELLGCQWKTI